MDITLEVKKELNSKYGKNNWKIKTGHGGVQTLYVKDLNTNRFVFESYEVNRVLDSYKAQT